MAVLKYALNAQMARICSCFLVALCLAMTQASGQIFRVQEGTELNVREGPGTGHNIIDRLGSGTEIEELERQGSWSRVTLPTGVAGWVYNKYFQPGPDPTAARNSVPKTLSVGVQPQKGHVSRIASVTFSSDGKHVLTGSYDQTARLWDVGSGKAVRGFQGHDGPVESVAISVDSKLVLTGGGEDSTARVWDAETGEVQRIYEGHKSIITGVALSPDKKYALTASWDNTAHLWDTATGSTIHILEHGESWVLCVAFGPYGKRILTGDLKGIVRMWDAQTGAEIRSFSKFDASVEIVRFDTSGRKVVGVSADGEVRVWDTETGYILRETGKLFDSKFNMSSYALSPDGDLLLTGSSNTDESGQILLWDLDAADVIQFFGDNSTAVGSVAFSPDGKRVLAARSTGVDIWDLETGRPLNRFEDKLEGSAFMAFSPDGREFLTSGKNKTARLWDAALGQLTRVFQGHTANVNGVAFGPEGQRVLTASSDETARLWERRTGKPLYTLSGHEDRVSFVSYSPTGGEVLTGSWDGTARVWNTATGQLVSVLKGHAGGINGVRFSSDGRSVLTASDDKTARMWSADTGKELHVFEGHKESVFDVVFSPDGNFVFTGSFDGTIRKWNVDTGDQLEIVGPQIFDLASVAFSPDARFALIFSYKNTYHLIDLDTGDEVRDLKAEYDGFSLSFSANGETFLTGSNSGSIRLWKTSTGTELAQFASFNDGSWVVITPEGFFNASEGGAKHINVVRGLEVFSVDQVYDALYRPDLVREALAGDPDGKVAAAAAELDLEKIIEGGFPPRVNLISPEPEATIVGDGSGSGAVDVEVEIEATSGGIGKVEWSVNGVLQDLSERALSPLVLADGVEEAGGVSTVGETKRVTQSLYLAPGENEIQVVAYNAAGLIASDPLTFTLTLDEPEITDPKLYVLSVGVNDYFDSRLDLAYAASDAKAIGSALKVAGKEIYSDIIVETVLDEDVTKEGLEAAFERLETKVRPGDVFVFFLAGHGKTEDGRYYFLPHDFRYQDEGSFKTAGIGQEVMQEWFSKIRAQKSVLLFDTCESGTLTQEPVQRGTEALAAISRLNRAIGRTTLTASTDTAPALEGFRGHGLFTYTLLDAIAAADNDNDSAVDVTELASYLDRRLPEYSEAAFGYTQVPQMKVVGNTFPIAKATLVLSDEPAEIIPTTPTHVVIQPTNILAEAVNEATVVMELKPGAAVRLISSEDGWSLIARDGKELGYLAATSLLAIQ